MFLLAIVTYVIAYATLSMAMPSDVQNGAQGLKTQWENFKRHHHKDYPTMEEENRRFANFQETLKLISLRNAQEQRNGGQAVHGITRWADLSQSEFEASILTGVPSLKTEGNVADTSAWEAPKVGLGLVDWTGVYTTPVKDQGYCGSCWAFSATEQIESDAMRELGLTYQLSAEQVTQCTKLSAGCDGGATESAYQYLKGVQGIVTADTYPYTASTYEGVTGMCQADTSKAVISVKDFFFVLAGESAMTSYVQQTGPLSVCLDASLWNTYRGGIMTVCGNRVNHCVQAVGVDVVNGFWKVRNSWGVGWGEEGFIRLAYGKDTCAISNDPTYTLVGRT